MSGKDIYQIEEILKKNEELKSDELMLDLDNSIETCNRKRVDEIMELLGGYAKVIHQIRLIKMDYEEADIPEQYREIMEIVSYESFKALIEYINGGVIYLPRKKTLIKNNRLRYIYNLLVYNNYDYRYTANQIGLSEKHLRTYIKQYQDMSKK